MFLVHNPGIGVLLILILALVGALVWHLTHKKTGPGPDTRIRRALTAAEVAQDAAQMPPQPTPAPSPVPAPRGHYERLRESADRRIAAEGPLTTELVAQIPAARRPLPGVPLPLPPVPAPAPRPSSIVLPPARPAVSTGEHRSLLEMTVPELMAQIETDVATAMIPKLSGVPVLPDLPDRRIHALLPDGSEVVRYERAGKWFHEGPGLRAKLTLGQAAILASSRGAVVRSGLPGGGLFDLRVKQAREEEV